MPLLTKAIRPLVLALLAVCVLPSTSHAADREKITAAVDAAFRPLLAEHDVPGIAVAVTVGGEQSFFSYGVAAKDRNTPVTKDTLFEIGSVSKTFTATLAAYAQARGKLSLDDHPGKFMPQLRGKPIDSANLLHLGTYTTGALPLHLPNAVKSDEAMTALLQKLKPSAAPGTERRYSNPSIGLLGHLTAQAMGGNFADLIETEILGKLGLRHSYIRVPKAAIGDYAWGYNRDNKPTRMGTGVFAIEAYGVKSSAADMIRFVEANMRPETLEPQLARAIEGTHIGYFRIGEMVQGLGWEQYPFPVSLDRLQAGNATPIVMQPNPATPLTPPRMPTEPTLFNKTGSTGGFGTYVAFVPAKKIGIVMLANRNLPVPARIEAAHAVLQLLASQK
jgi:beta-lactamase class C